MPKRLHPGMYRHRVTINEKNVTQNATGEETISWALVGEYWASVEPLLGREFVEMRQAQAEITHRIRMRPQSGLHPAMQAVFDGREMDILSVIEVNERGREMHLMCKERVTYV